jgi:hypothetical protein
LETLFKSVFCKILEQSLFESYLKFLLGVLDVCSAAFFLHQALRLGVVQHQGGREDVMLPLFTFPTQFNTMCHKKINKNK